MNKIKDYIRKIVDGGNREYMEELSDMLDKIICSMKEAHPKEYNKYKNELYEMANGKKITEDMAKEWVYKMNPVGEYWNIDETTNAMRQLNYNLDPVDFYTVSNMMMNDYNDLVKNDETLALKMAKDWLNDIDAVDNKLYEYYKYITK